MATNRVKAESAYWKLRISLVMVVLSLLVGGLLLITGPSDIAVEANQSVSIESGITGGIGALIGILLDIVVIP